MSIVVQILYSEGCPHTSATIDLIKHVSQDMNLAIELETVQIENQEQAKELNFPGSPTIRINGVDIDPAAAPVQFSGFT